MNALASFIRALIVAGVTLLLEKIQFPVESIPETAKDVADVVFLILSAGATWALTKYAPQLLSRLKGKTGLWLLLVCCSLLMWSCAALDNLTKQSGFSYNPGTKEYSAWWTNDEGRKFRARGTADRISLVEYQSESGEWIRWSDQSGILIGNPPDWVNSNINPTK